MSGPPPDDSSKQGPDNPASDMPHGASNDLPNSVNAAAPATGRAPAHVQVAWAGARRFDAGRPGGPTIRLDGDAETGPSPVDGLLSALAACTAVDVVDILAKRRTPVASLTVDVVGERFPGTPGRVTHVRLVYRMTGAGIARGHAERAIELAVTKYCSVRDSLDPAIPIEWVLELEAGAAALGT